MKYRYISRQTANVRVAAVAAVGAVFCALLWTVQARGEEPSTRQGELAQSSSPAIDEGKFISVNGIEQWVTIRGRDLRNPVLLILHGGPGMSLSGLAPHFAEWEKSFTLVQWDQPNSGATHLRNRETGQGELTIDRYTRDGIAVAEYARAKLKKEKVILFGTSWGTVLGIEMIRKSPELFSAYVGTAQVVSARDGGKLGYELALQAAKNRNDKTAIEALERVGPPPFKSFEHFLVRQQYSNPPFLPMSSAEQAATMKFMKTISVPPPADAHYNAYKTLPPGFDGAKMFMDALRAVFDECWRWEARDLGLSFKVPVYIFQGANDINTPASLAREYLNEIEAPKKVYVELKETGHNVIVFQDVLLRLLQEHIVDRGN